LTWTLSGFADEAGGSVSEQIEALHSSGFKYIDIRSVNGYGIAELPVDQATMVRKVLDDSGILVQMLGSPVGKIDIEDDFSIDLNRLKHLARLAPILGTNAVRIFSYYNRSLRPHGQWREIVFERLLALRNSARALGLVLFHENERGIFGDSPSDVALIAAELRDGVSFKTIFDFDNYTQGGVNAWDAWLAVKADVDAFHLKDSLNFSQVPVGQGDGHVEQILVDALSSGWDGPLSVEPHLSHSGAVAATGPSGLENRAYKDMSEKERFVLASKAATALLTKIGASYE